LLRYLGPGVDDFWLAIRLVFDDGLAVFHFDLDIARFFIYLTDKPPIAVANIHHFLTSSLKDVSFALTFYGKKFLP
jgi:hypothetical protein